MTYLMSYTDVRHFGTPSNECRGTAVLPVPYFFLGFQFTDMQVGKSANTISSCKIYIQRQYALYIGDELLLTLSWYLSMQNYR